MVRLGEQIHPHSQSVCPMLATNETLEVLPNSGRVGGRSQIACLNFNISHGIVFLVHHAPCQKSTGHFGRNNNYYKNNICCDVLDVFGMGHSACHFPLWQGLSIECNV